MPASAVWRFTDPDEFTAHVRGTSMELTVTRPGRFSAKALRVDLHRLWIQRTSTWGGGSGLTVIYGVAAPVKTPLMGNVQR